MLIAKRRAALRELHRTLREREMQKHYRALVVGRWPFGRKTIDLPLKTNLKQGGERVVRVHPEGQHAISTFEPLQHFAKLATLLDVKIGTGRTHQIRVHAAHAGHPIAGDEKYGDRERDAALKPVRIESHVSARAFARRFSASRKRRRAVHRSTALLAATNCKAVLDRLEPRRAIAALRLTMRLSLPTSSRAT